MNAHLTLFQAPENQVCARWDLWSHGTESLELVGDSQRLALQSSVPDLRGTFIGSRLPLVHHKHLKSTNLLERLNEEFKWRTSIVRIPQPSFLQSLTHITRPRMARYAVTASRRDAQIGFWRGQASSDLDLRILACAG
jgi:mutator family transposase